MTKTPLYLFFVFLLHSLDSKAQLSYNFYISNSGSDTNQGISTMSPKQTITGSATALRNFAKRNGIVTVGLQSRSTFNESLAPDYSLEVGVYDNSTATNDFAIMNGSDSFDTGWNVTTGPSNIYEQEIKYSKFTGFGINGIGNYSYIYVVEIDKQLERFSPYSARHVLQLAPSLTAADTIPGSFFEPVLPLGVADNVIKVYIHTSNGESPNKSKKYRYEVTVRDKAIDGYIYDNNRFENLWVRGYGAGYGLLPGGANSYYNKIVFGPGAAIHHAVIKNGTLNNCLFLSTGKNISGGAVVFYDVQGFGRHNKIQNSIFLDIPTAVYAHTSNGTNHGAVELNHVLSFPGNSGYGGLISTSSTDTVSMNQVYCDGHLIGYNNGSAPMVEIKNSYFKGVATGMSFSGNPIHAVVDNVFIATNIFSKSTGIALEQNTSIDLRNSIIHVKGTQAGYFVAGATRGTAHVAAQGNIFISSTDTIKSVYAAITNTNAGIGTSLDSWNNNVYVLTSGSGIYWTVTNPATNNGTPYITSFSEWQRQSGQDKNSLFFDLRKDPRGLQAIFIDPDNGNYELANTVEGNKVRALKAGMTTPLHCYLKKPTYEEAAEMIENDRVMKVDDCRNPCQSIKVKVTPLIQQGANGDTSICQGGEMSFKGSADFAQNNTYYHQSNFTTRYLWWFSDGKDTSGNNLGTVKHTFTNGKPTDVRLQMVDANGCNFDTTITIKVLPSPVNPTLGNDTSLCTGQTLHLLAEKSTAANHYRWSTGDTAVTTIAVTEAGEYWVEAKDQLGCTIADTILVTNKTLVSVILGRDTAFCASSPNLLVPAVTGNVKSYFWNTGATTDTLRANSPGTYTLTVKDAGVCLAKDTIMLTNNLVNSFSLPNDTTICKGTSYMLTLHPPAATIIAWNDGLEEYSHFIEGGTYSIAANNNGCIKKDSIVVKVQPLPVVRLMSDTFICSGYGLPLSVSYPGAGYRWSNGSRDSSIVANSEGIYWVQATVNGCSFRDSITLSVQHCACNIEIPTAFSPNGDGINDVLRPKMDCFPVNYNLSVFNRYGQVVFSTKNYNTGWDGISNNQPLPVGTYYYILTFTNTGFPGNKPYTGSITLLR